MQQLKYINPAGKEMDISLTPPYILESITGIGGADSELMTGTPAAQDGSRLRGIRLSSRNIKVTFNIQGKNLTDMYEQRRTAERLTAAALNRSGVMSKLIYTNDFGSWQIPCIVSSGINPDKRLKNFQHCSISFFCPSPYFRAVNSISERLAYFDAGLEFPLDLDSGLQVQFGTRGYEAFVYNLGDTPSPLRITITGPATEPEIWKASTGEYIKIARELAEGDMLFINTDPDNLEVTIIRGGGRAESAFGYLDLESALFLLEPGENRLTYQSGDDTTSAMVEIEAQSWYGGV